MTNEEQRSIELITELVNGENALARYGILIFADSSDFEDGQSSTFKAYINNEVRLSHSYHHSGLQLGELIETVKQRCYFINYRAQKDKLDAAMHEVVQEMSELYLKNNSRLELNEIHGIDRKVTIIMLVIIITLAIVLFIWSLIHGI